MRPKGRHDMHAWLSLLKEQLEKHARTDEGAGGAGSVSISLTGWVGMRRRQIDGAPPSEPYERAYAVLAIQQKEVGDAIAVSQTLYWFASEAEASDFSSGSAIDLAEVDAILTEPLPPAAGSSATGSSILLQTDAGWQLDLSSEDGAPAGAPPPPRAPTTDEWLSQLRRHCVNAEGYDSTANDTVAATGGGGDGGGVSGGGGRSKMSHRLRMVVPRSAHKGDSMPRGKAADDAGASKGVWYHFEVDLYPDGRLSFTQSADAARRAPSVWASGNVDVSQAS